MNAVVAMPTTPEIDDPYSGAVALRWVGQPVDAEGEIHVDDPFIPEIFGRLLVDTYWELDADIEAWWDLFVTGNRFPCPPTEDSGTSNWVYVGTARFLIIFHYIHDGWEMAKLVWSDDPAYANFELVS
jgi:hypothetical protein